MSVKEDPYVIQAIQWTGENIEEVKQFIQPAFHYFSFPPNGLPMLMIDVAGSYVIVPHSFYLIIGPERLLYMVNEKTFNKTCRRIKDEGLQG